MDNLAIKIKNLFGSDGFIPLHEPKFNANASKYVLDCIQTGWVSTAGKYVSELEDRFCTKIGAKYAVAVSSGTAALHLSVLASGVRPNDEVICPDITFVASCNAITYCGAIPHFVDVSLDDLCIDVQKLKQYLSNLVSTKNGKCFNKFTGRRLSAIIAVHAFGFSADVEKLREVASTYNMDLIEDAACAIGARHNNEFIGSSSKLASFSFNGNKIITGGAGGLVVTSDAKIAEKIKHLSTTAKIPHKWEYIHDEVGYNYRMPNINAALLLSQLESLEEAIANKRQLFQKYDSIISPEDEVELVREKEDTKSNYWLICLKLKKASNKKRDQLLHLLNSKNIMARPLWRPISGLKPYKECPKGDLANSKTLYNQIINIPSSPHLLTLCKT